MVARLMYARMLFFETTPTSRILNHVSTGTQQIDETLPKVHITLQHLYLSRVDLSCQSNHNIHELELSKFVFEQANSNTPEYDHDNRHKSHSHWFPFFAVRSAVPGGAVFYCWNCHRHLLRPTLADYIYACPCGNDGLHTESLSRRCAGFLADVTFINILTILSLCISAQSYILTTPLLDMPHFETYALIK